MSLFIRNQSSTFSLTSQYACIFLRKKAIPCVILIQCQISLSNNIVTVKVYCVLLLQTNLNNNFFPKNEKKVINQCKRLFFLFKYRITPHIKVPRIRITIYIRIFPRIFIYRKVSVDVKRMSNRQTY